MINLNSKFKKRLPAGLRVLLSTASFVAVVAANAQAPAPEDIAWLKSKVVPLKTCEAQNGFEDLQPLKKFIGEARIVSLGECTHGTREVFQMKHRLLEFLATEMGFTIFSIEANMPEAYRLNDYVLNGTGDPEKLISGMYFWTWNTEEVLAMVEWMRKFNQSGKGRVEFTGFDMQTPDVAMDVVLDFLNQYDKERVAEVQTKYARLRNGKYRQRGGQGGGSFGVATGSFPVEAAKGKKIRYSGWIKTAGLTNGYAGLWWRADGDSGVLAFNNMQEQKIQGDTDWKEYDITLEIPTNTININFGAIMPGEGKAWFDDLKVEIDGKNFDLDSVVDSTFEGKRSTGFFLAGQGYKVAVDDKVAKNGQKSLRMEYSKGIQEKETVDLPPADVLAKECGEILSALESKETDYQKSAPKKSVDWVIQNARVVQQCMQLELNQSERDKSMADNVKWILDHAPAKTKIVLWAHNGHVSRQASFGGKAMGAYLDTYYGKKQVVIGFAAGEGQYTAILQGKGLRSDNLLQEPTPASYEGYFRASGVPIFFLNLHNGEDTGAQWLEKTHANRSIGALAMEFQFAPVKLGSFYDGMIYIDKTSASRSLPGAMSKRGKSQ